MKVTEKDFELAISLSAAFEPVIDACLAHGISSPQLEYVVRAAFVRRSFASLPRHHRTGRPPSDTAVSLAAGLHRNEVSKIRTGGSVGLRRALAAKEKLYSKCARVMHGWRTDRRFLTPTAKPRDLAVGRNRQRPNFTNLVDRFGKGVYPGTLLKEMARQGHIERLEGDLVRLKPAAPANRAMSPAATPPAARRRNRREPTRRRGRFHPTASGPSKKPKPSR